MLYTEDSAADQCTLYQLRNLINRRNVPKDLKEDVNATEDFLQLVTDAHIVAAAGKELGSQMVIQFLCLHFNMLDSLAVMRKEPT